LNWEIDVDALPMGEEERVPAGVVTTIMARTVMPAPGKRVDIVEVTRHGGGREEKVVGEIEGLGEGSGEDDTDEEVVG